MLFDGGSAPLAMFGPKLSALASRDLGKLGVELHMGSIVTHVDPDGLDVKDHDGKVTRYDGVAGWPHGALEHDQVTDAREIREPVEQPSGETRRGDDADVQHQLRGATEGSAAAVGPAVAAGLVTPRAAAGGPWASADGGGGAGGAGPILAEAT